MLLYIGDFNVNWLTEKATLYNLIITENHYRQLMSCYTDNKNCTDHIYTNMDEDKIQAIVWETYFSDHTSTSTSTLLYLALHF